MVVSVGDVGPGLSVVCQVRRTTNYTVTGAWADIAFDAVDVETNDAEIEHDYGGGGTDRIYVKTAGTYRVSIQGHYYAGATGAAYVRLRVNDTTVVNGSTWRTYQQNVDDPFARSVEVPLSAGDFLTWQAYDSVTGASFTDPLLFTVSHYTGSTGADGADGDIVWANAWTSQNYTINQAVSYLGSSYVCKLDTVSSEVPTDTTYWDVLAAKGEVGDAGAPNVPMVQARESSAITLGASWADIPFDTTDVETADTEIKHHDSNTDQIHVYTTGVYDVTVEGTASFNNTGIELRVRSNDTTVIPGSVIEKHWGAGTTNASFSKSFLVTLTAGDYLTVQGQYATAPRGILADMLFSVRRYVGIEGEKGDTGDTGLTGPAGAAEPTAGGFGYNAATITTDKTLTDSDDTIQTLTCNTADLKVLLPTITEDTPFFLLVNPATSSYSYDIADANGVTRVTCEPGQQVKVQTDAVDSFLTVLDNVPSTVGFITFPFGGYCHSSYVGRYYQTNYEYYAQAVTSGLTYANEYTVPVDGTIKYITFACQSAVDSTFKIVINGTPGAGITLAGTYFANEEIDIAVSAGDTIALEFDAYASAPNYSVACLYMEADSGAGYTSKPFGAYLQSVNYFHEAGGRATSSQLSSEASNGARTTLNNCTLSEVSWRTENTMATQELSAFKNGILSETKAYGTGTSGVMTGWATHYAPGDDCAFRATTAAPFRVQLLAAFSGSGSTALEHYGSAVTTNYWQYNRYNQKTNNGGSNPALNIRYEYVHVIPQTGLITGFTLSAGLNSGSKPMTVAVVGSGGSESATVVLVDYRGYAEFDAPIPVVAGDYVYIYPADTTNLSSGTFSLMYKIID